VRLAASKCAAKSRLFFDRSIKNICLVDKHSLLIVRHSCTSSATSPAFKSNKMPPLTVEDRLLIKPLRIEKGWAVDRMIAESPAKVVTAYFVLFCKKNVFYWK